MDKLLKSYTAEREEVMGSIYQHQTTNKEVTYDFMKIFTKLIISFSMFTFFLSNPSWLSLFLQSFFSHVSSFPSQVLSHINDKNYIFLLFNGILVIILKKSSSRKITENSSNFQPPEVVMSTSEVPAASEAGIEKEILMVGKSEVRERESVEEQDENGEEEEEENDKYYVGGVIEERSTSNMSTEELNRKFEEFIRKMKEEIRIEAQQQFLMV